MSLSIFCREDEYLVNMQHTVIPSWYQREGYIKSMATLIENELTKFPVPQKVRQAMTLSTCGSVLSQKGRRLVDLVDIYFMCCKSLYKAISCVEEYMQYFFPLILQTKHNSIYTKLPMLAKRLSVLLKGLGYIILKEKKDRGLDFFRHQENCLF
jgi:hypothetical protein